MTGTAPRAVVLSGGDDEVTDAVVRALRDAGSHADLVNDVGSVACVLAHRADAVTTAVYVPGLLAADEQSGDPDPAGTLLDYVTALGPNLRAVADGGSRVVAVGSRDWLGWPNRPRTAARSAALVATVRSLALAHGRAGVTVNAVLGLPLDAAARREAGVVDGTHLHEPLPLTGTPVLAEDIAATVAFFLDERSGYITGQVLHCCGGASLLSSLSV